MSIKIKQAITECLEKVASKEFDEETIRTLLIVSREYLQYDGLIKELAHFIAHPKRNKGLFHKSVNTRYTKFKLVEEQVLSKNLSEISKEIKTEDELSDFMLDGVGVDKIEAKLFEILYHDGLDDLPEEHLLKYIGLTKLDAEKILKENYTKIKGHYYLNVIKTEKMISFSQYLPKTNPEEDEELNKKIQEAQLICNKTRSKMDSLQRIIRGAIHFRSVFDTKTLIEDFRINFSRILEQFEIDKKYLDAIECNIHEILVCLMALLHDSTFEFYDKNTANVFLCVYSKFDISNDKTPESACQNLYESGVLALYTNYIYRERTNKYPLYVSEIPLKSLISKEEFLNSDITQSINKIPWISAKREGKNLILKKYN